MRTSLPVVLAVAGVTDGPEPDLVWLAAIVVAALASVTAMRLRLRESTHSGADDVEATDRSESQATV